jgi:hypothetical protein
VQEGIASECGRRSCRREKALRLNNPPVPNHQRQVAILENVQPVGDQEGRAVSHQPLQRFLVIEKTGALFLWYVSFIDEASSVVKID